MQHGGENPVLPIAGFSVAARAERLSCSYEEQKGDSVLIVDRRGLERLICQRKLKNGR